MGKNIYNFPNLPVPEISTTMFKFLDWVKPLISNEEFSEIEKEVQFFLNNSDSFELQQILLKKTLEKNSNWLFDWWAKYMYLSSRGPIAIDCNASMILNIGDKKDLPIHIVLGAFAYKTAELYLDFKIKGEPLLNFGKKSMSLDQFHGIFAGMRIPNKNFDDYYINQEISENIIFIKNNVTYSIKVIENETLLPIENICKSIYDILNVEKEKKFFSINFITAHTNRDKAKDLWDKIEQLENNKEKLKKVKNSIIVLNYDDVILEEEDLNLINPFYGLHYNRWHGKGMNLTVTKNKVYGFIADHTYQDGGTSITFIALLVEFLNGIDYISVSEATKSNYEKIEFSSNSEIDNELLVIEKNYLKWLNSTIVGVWETNKINRVFLKNKEIISADAFVHVIFQLAQYSINKKLRNTYIAVDLRNFYKGRTECVRPISEYSKKFVEKWFNSDLQNNFKEIMNLLNKIMEIHHSRVQDCKKGEGINRHMLGLFLAYKENKEKFKKMPKIFETNAWKIISENPISTSSIAHPLIKSALFYPVHPEGIGIFYLIDKDKFKIILSSWTKNKEYHKNFLANLEDIVNKLFEILIAK